VVGIAIPSFLLARMPGFQLHWIWYLSVVSIALQMLVSLWLLRREMDAKLKPATAPVAMPAPLATAPEP